jgi:acyl carrier protein
VAKAASPADVIREVISRMCATRVDDETLLADLNLDVGDRAELLVALELALRCEAGDITLTDDLTIADLIDVLTQRAA